MQDVIQLRAISREDGWAFVQNGSRFFHIRPPYSEDAQPATEAQVARSAYFEDYHAEDRPFAGWSELVRFLNSEVRSARERESSSGETQASDLRAILAMADEAMLTRLLDRVEKELVSAGNHNAARRAMEEFEQVGRAWPCGIQKRIEVLAETQWTTSEEQTST